MEFPPSNLQERQEAITNPYENSTVVATLKERKEKGLPLRIACLDLDSSIYFEFSPTDPPDKRVWKEGMRKKTEEVMKELKERGYVIVFVTSKPEEMVMSEEQYKKSPDFGRPVPKMGYGDDGRRVHVPPEQVLPAGMIDPDIIIGTTGNKILVKQENGGYALDRVHQKQVIKADVRKWRTATEKTITWLHEHGSKFKVGATETWQNYEAGRMDVAPPDFRIGIGFTDKKELVAFKQNLAEIKSALSNPIKSFKLWLQGFRGDMRKFIFNTRILIDSQSDKSLSLYMMPTGGNKARGIETIAKSLSETSGISQDKIEFIIAGDSLVDWKGGTLAPTKSKKVTFVVVGGSRLTDVITQPTVNTFGGVELEAYKRRLKKTDRVGLYKFRPPVENEREIYVGNEAFTGLIGPETLLEVIRQNG